MSCSTLLWEYKNGNNYRMAGNFGGRIFWLITENMSFGGIYFGGWVSLSHITIFIAKWLIKCAGNLIRPWASFRSVRTKSMIKCNSKLNKSLLRLLWTIFVPSVFTVTVYTSFGPPSSRWQTSQLFSFGAQNSLEKRCPRTQLSKVNAMPTIRLARLAAGLVHKLWIYNNDDITVWSFWWMRYWLIALKTANPPKFLAIRYYHSLRTHSNWKHLTVYGQYSYLASSPKRPEPAGFRASSRAFWKREDTIL